MHELDAVVLAYDDAAREESVQTGRGVVINSPFHA